MTGGTLGGVLELRLELDFPALAAIASGCCEGLRYLHEARPPLLGALSPGAVLLDSRLSAKICLSVRPPGEPGEPHVWEPPEVLGGKPPSPEGDCYSFGMLCFELFARQRAFEPLLAHAPLEKVLHAVATSDVRPSFPEGRGVAQPLVDLIKDCWCGGGRAGTAPEARRCRLGA